MSEGDSDAISAVDTDCQGIEAQVAKLRFQLALSGPYDRSAVILAVHASEGGTESQDWAEMVLRMYTRWAEKRGCTAEVLDVTVGDEAGIKNATLQITGDYAYGYARSERGGTGWCAFRHSTASSDATPALHWSRRCRWSNTTLTW